MEKEFIGYSEALALKELGFDEPCFGFYNKEDKPNLGYCANGFQDDATLEIKCTAPLYQQALRWFREKYGLESWVYKSRDKVYFYSILKKDRYLNPSCQYSTYEEAELECLKKLIEIVKQQK